MKNLFVKTININGIKQDFRFEAVDYPAELKYHIYFHNPSSNREESFRMYKDESGQWKIAAQVLPSWVHQHELDFNDAIEDDK